jgi:hypothetical protein
MIETFASTQQPNQKMKKSSVSNAPSQKWIWKRGRGLCVHRRWGDWGFPRNARLLFLSASFFDGQGRQQRGRSLSWRVMQTVEREFSSLNLRKKKNKKKKRKKVFFNACRFRLSTMDKVYTLAEGKRCQQSQRWLSFVFF